jgi:hypothetical protein
MAQQRHVDDQHQRHALPAETGVEIALDPVVRAAAAVLGNRLGVLGLGAIQLSTLGQHLFQAAGLRAVGVFFGFALGVMLAVDGDPFVGDHASRQPEPEAEEMRRDGTEIQRPVSLGTMQEDRDRSDRDVRHNQRIDHQLPCAQIGQTIGQPVQKRVQDVVHASKTSATAAMQRNANCRGEPPNSRDLAHRIQAVACESTRSLACIKPIFPTRRQKIRLWRVGEATTGVRRFPRVRQRARPGT